MASVFVHAALPLVARRLFPLPAGRERALAVTASLLAAWPDLDLVAFVFERRPPDVLAHGGITHALWTAGMAAVLAVAIVFRELRWGSRDWKRVLFYFAAAAGSHGIVDALTANDHGVALFAPFVDARVASPWKLLPALQTGLQEAFGFVGLLVVANELLYVVLPVAILVMMAEAGRDPERRKRAWRVGAGWGACAIGLRLAMPAWFAPTTPRVLAAVGSADAGDPQAIRHDDLPEGKLITRLDDLRSRGLLDRALEPAHPAWSSSFFPSWFGGEAGRWRDPTTTLVWRTLTGFTPPSATEARAWAGASKERLSTLSPTEKLDLALGRYDFPATWQALGHSHNKRPLPRYWSGRCNGIATAAIATPEPHRVVDVIARDGTPIPFHPNDVKSLLSVAYYQVPSTLVGEVCDVVALDAGAKCSMNPAVLVIAAANRIGIARRTFLVDALPTIAKQYYAVASARIDRVGAPRPLGGEKIDAALVGRATAVQDVAITLVLSSTTLGYARADVRDPAQPHGGHYARVGVVPVTMSYRARLALDDGGELVGGMWTGDPPDGPDNVLIVEGEPELVGENLAAATAIPWSFVRELARLSAGEAEPAVLDLRAPR